MTKSLTIIIKIVEIHELLGELMILLGKAQDYTLKTLFHINIHKKFQSIIETYFGNEIK